MNKNSITELSDNFEPLYDVNVMENIFKQYERVIIESLITSFGLDFIIKDQYGGDVDTINNVRKIDENMKYKNSDNEKIYSNKGKYDTNSYHTDKAYKQENKRNKELKKNGNLIDEYTGKRILLNEKSDLDHVISAKEIHEDRGRVLAGVSGINLANDKKNLKITNPRTNRTKKASSMNEFHEKYSREYTKKELNTMKKIDFNSRKNYEKIIFREYYCSNKFKKDVTVAAGTLGIKMGVREVLGFAFAEVWFAIKEEFDKLNEKFDYSNFFISIGNGIKKGFQNAKEKYSKLFDKLKGGIISGIISSLTTTLCNIFFTTAKNIAKIIRQTYVSLVQAAKILFINPEGLNFGDRMRAVTKILSVGASIVFGSIISEALGKTQIAGTPIVGEIVQTFCGTLTTGILSCSLLYFLDNSEFIKKIVDMLNKLPSFNSQINYYKEQSIYFEAYAAELMKIDIEEFREEIELYNSFTRDIEDTKDETQLNIVLKNIFNKLEIKIPWKGEFNSFMENKDSVLVFE